MQMVKPERFNFHGLSTLADNHSFTRTLLCSLIELHHWCEKRAVVL